jgi:hypothetical protein
MWPPESGHPMPTMKQRFGPIKVLVVIVKALLFAGALLLLGSYFGLHVREAGGNVVSASEM